MSLNKIVICQVGRQGGRGYGGTSDEDESVPIDQIIELVTNQQMIEMEKIMGSNTTAQIAALIDSKADSRP